MSSQLLDPPAPLVPSEADKKLAGEASSSIRGENARNIKLILDGETIEIPDHAKRMIQSLLSAMSRGLAIQFMPIDTEMTTQSAANYLGVSRPFLIKQIQKGLLPFHTTGTHRRIRLTDLLEYRKAMALRQAEALSRLSKRQEEMGLDY